MTSNVGSMFMRKDSNSRLAGKKLWMSLSRLERLLETQHEADTLDEVGALGESSSCLV